MGHAVALSDTMSSIQATRMKKGMLIKVGEDLFRVLELQHVTPGNLRGFVRVKFRNIRTGTLSDQKLRSEDSSSAPRSTSGRCSTSVSRRRLLPLHGHRVVRAAAHLRRGARRCGELHHPDAVINVEFYGAEPVGIELPVTVDLKVEDTAPGIKGATASAQVKPARLETGLVVQVPPFVNTGDKVRVSTETGEYLSRA